MRIALLAPGYPSPEAPHEYAFVHARARLYQPRGHDVHVFRPGGSARWTIDGIPVASDAGDELRKTIEAFRPDVLAVHAPSFRTIPIARRIACRQVSWVHGHEALWSLRRVHYAQGAAARAWKAVKLVPLNVIQLALIREFLPTQASVVFVSRWMKEAAERHTIRRVPNAVLIPNPVDIDAFTYRYDPANRAKGVSVRSFNSTKYGIDVAIRAFAFPGAGELTIVGRGPLERQFRTLLSRTGSRAKLDVRSVPHPDMPGLLAGYGFFVAASRVEAQGVAMCEAMACGLPIVATRAGGIPEFVEDGREGFLVPVDDAPALAAAVERLLADPERQLAMSHRARERMVDQCAPNVVITRELRVLAGDPV